MRGISAGKCHSYCCVAVGGVYGCLVEDQFAAKGHKRRYYRHHRYRHHRCRLKKDDKKNIGVVAALGFTEGAWDEIVLAPCKIYLETPSSIGASLKRVYKENEREYQRRSDRKCFGGKEKRQCGREKMGINLKGTSRYEREKRLYTTR